MDVPIFWCEETGVRSCYRGHWCSACSTSTRVEEPVEAWDTDFPEPRPVHPCKQCGKDVPMNSRGLEREMRRVDTGETFRSHGDLPVGAVWEMLRDDRESPHNWRQSPRPDGKVYIIHRPNKQDRRVLVVKLPDGHDWVIDSRCNNCTLPDDDKHWCWVRHGRPEDGTLHVDKNGRTCSAGAGSIATSKYHGFLHHGKLTNC